MQIAAGTVAELIARYILNVGGHLNETKTPSEAEILIRLEKLRQAFRTIEEGRPISLDSREHQNVMEFLALGKNEYNNILIHDLDTSDISIPTEEIEEKLQAAIDKFLDLFGVTLSTFGYQLGKLDPAQFASDGFVDMTKKHDTGGSFTPDGM